MCVPSYIYTSSMAVGPAHPATDVQTDLQNVPIDRVSDTHKLLILLMSH